MFDGVDRIQLKRGFHMGYKEDFIQIYQEKIQREGAQELLEWLQKTDFFIAPASTKFHCACLGGLVQHSVNVYRVMLEKHFDPETDSEESFAICGLLHDICKAEFYKEGTRNVKNEETGAWEKRPFYSIEDKYPYGHGEKSVFLIERFMRLKTSEAIAIRWHMGGFDEAEMCIRDRSYPVTGGRHSPAVCFCLFSCSNRRKVI